MPNDNVTKLIQPGAFEYPLTEVLRNGSRERLAACDALSVVDHVGHVRYRIEYQMVSLCAHHNSSSTWPIPRRLIARKAFWLIL